MIRTFGPIVGVELTGHVARAVVRPRLGAAPRGNMEDAFDPERPERAVASLRARLGDVGGIAIAIGFAHLELKAVRLPPLDRAEQLRILSLEPDRFFLSEKYTALSLSPNGLACAADGDAVERWVRAFSAWGRVTAVVDAPSALTRALAGVEGDGALVVPGELTDGGVAVIELSAGLQTGARRVPAGIATEGRPLPAAHGLRPEELTAYGAALAAAAPPEDQILTSSLREAFRRRRLVTSTRRWAAVAAVTILLVVGLDRWRQLAFDRSGREIATLADSAATPLSLLQALAVLDRRETLAGDPSTSLADPLDVLAALSARLPADATVLSLSMIGDEWQIDGRARNAATIVPVLDGGNRFATVRVAGASTRFTENGVTWETFSVAFRARAGR